MVWHALSAAHAVSARLKARGSDRADLPRAWRSEIPHNTVVCSSIDSFAPPPPHASSERVL